MAVAATLFAVAGTAVADDLVIHRSARLGVPTFVTGQNGNPIPVNPAANAQPAAQPAVAVTTSADFFTAHGDVFGITDPATQLIQTRVSNDAIGWTHTTYSQVFNNIPVFSGILKVHQNANGDIMSVNGRFYPLSPKLSTTPLHDQVDAELTAIDSVAEASPYVAMSQLVIVDPGWYGDELIGARLAWHIIVEDPTAPLREAFFIDANCGEVLDQWSMIHTAKDRAIYDGNGGSTLPGTLARPEGAGPVATPEDVNRAYDYYGDTYDYFLRAFGRDSIDDNGLTMIATVNSTRPSCPNAGWNGVQMIFCLGTVTDDVVGHELAHGVTQYTADLIYQNQSGQLNESYSDVFGELIDLFNGDAAFAGSPPGPAWPTHATGTGLDTPNPLRGVGCSTRSAGFPEGVRWLLGEDATAFSSEIRDMWNPPCRNHPDFANSVLQTCPSNDGGGVHSGSGVPNHAFAMLTDGKTFNGHTVVGIGPIKSGAIWYRALTEYLTVSSDFADAYLAINASAADLVGFDPNDPRTGAPSGSPITAVDAVQVDEALLAVEMHTDGACGATDSVLNSAAAVVCGDSTTIFADDFESGVNGWTVSNSAPPTPYDWMQSSSLALGRTGTGWFCEDPNLGDCGAQDESGFHSLLSPVINIPGGSPAPYASFDHYISAEGSYDGGDVKINVNSGGWNPVPRSAYKFNPYNGRYVGAAQGNTNPFAGEQAWTGAGGGWGTSVISLAGFATAGDAVQFRFDLSKDGCTGAGGWYLDDFKVYSCGDCNNDATPDIDEVFFANASGPLGNIGSGSPRSHTIVSPPVADTDVVLTFTARGDFSASNEYLDVTVNGNDVGRVLDGNAGDCPGTPEFQELVIPAATWNAAVAGGNAEITMTASSAVNANLCSSSTYVTVFTRYGLAITDCDSNGAIDACQMFDGGIQPFVDRLLGNAPYLCIFDLAFDGEINGADIQPFVSALLGG